MNTDCTVTCNLSCVDINMYVGGKIDPLHCSIAKETQQTESQKQGWSMDKKTEKKKKVFHFCFTIGVKTKNKNKNINLHLAQSSSFSLFQLPLKMHENVHMNLPPASPGGVCSTFSFTFRGIVKMKGRPCV